MSQATNSHASVPFFEIQSYPENDRLGRIIARTANAESMGILDFYCCRPEDLDTALEVDDIRFIQPDSVRKALLYIAACIADEQGKDVVYCRHISKRVDYRTGRDSEAPNIWHAMKVRPLLEHYRAVAHCR